MKFFSSSLFEIILQELNVWEDNWDDEAHESDFSKQLRCSILHTYFRLFWPFPLVGHSWRCFNVWWHGSDRPISLGALATFSLRVVRQNSRSIIWNIERGIRSSFSGFFRTFLVGIQSVLTFLSIKVLCSSLDNLEKSLRKICRSRGPTLAESARKLCESIGSSSNDLLSLVASSYY